MGVLYWPAAELRAAPVFDVVLFGEAPKTHFTAIHWRTATDGRRSVPGKVTGNANHCTIIAWLTCTSMRSL